MPFSELESFIRNIAYMLTIFRMVNAVKGQGIYWVANSFIWVWLLLPVAQLGELIKKEVAADKKYPKKPCSLPRHEGKQLLWLAYVDTLVKPFMRAVLRYEDSDRVFSLVLILIGFNLRI